MGIRSLVRRLMLRATGRHRLRKSTFFSLPPEIRIVIYKLVAASLAITTRSWTGRGLYAYPDRYTAKYIKWPYLIKYSNIQLLAVSRSIRCEALPIFLEGASRFYISKGALVHPSLPNTVANLVRMTAVLKIEDDHKQRLVLKSGTNDPSIVARRRIHQYWIKQALIHSSLTSTISHIVMSAAVLESKCDHNRNIALRHDTTDPSVTVERPLSRYWITNKKTANKLYVVCKARYLRYWAYAMNPTNGQLMHMHFVMTLAMMSQEHGIVDSRHVVSQAHSAANADDGLYDTYWDTIMATIYPGDELGCKITVVLAGCPRHGVKLTFDLDVLMKCAHGVQWTWMDTGASITPADFRTLPRRKCHWGGLCRFFH
ncbi:uncharacterized protein AB675_1282 [Cyphellophora attinorum]|uniref:F-box domain-containing protein n=1 Tax=Cyphellophora attinorum TaxID=1664694 RepID=A0A0N1GYD4_9EURO|nr:uncharacterized protein AB675_1282 [Phialophora attinorum]KPI35722.1 hypothetical protein AB675_1282 [Phialophora attinorum]